MKPTEYPEQDARTVPIETKPAEPAETRPRGENLRYVDLPPAPEEAKAQRNLAAGIVCLLLAAIGVWLGLKFDRGTTLLCLFSSLGAFGIAWLFHNMHVLKQRNGQFFGIAITALLGAAIPFVAAGLSSLDKMADKRLAGGSTHEDEAGSRSVPPPVPTAANAPAAPTAPELSPEDLLPSEPPPRQGAVAMSAEPKPAPKKALPPDDGIIRDFIAPVPDPKAGRLVAIKQDCMVEIDGRKWRLKAGQMYKLKLYEDGIVTFMAGDQEVTISDDLVKFTGNSLEDKARIQQLAWNEAVARYPVLRDESSKELQMYEKKRLDIRDEEDGKVFFEDPRWPVVLADLVASENKWVAAGDVAAAESNATAKAEDAAKEPVIPEGELPPVPGNGAAAPEQKSPTSPPVVPPVVPPAPQAPVVPPIIPPAPGN